ncbi:glutamate 5-kinase [Acinetobacter soli]|uniref:glutamate 5-kinase n=1 Tax=Acinetobacter soli TaxID=487316 RepID=UPI001F2EA529|nr:glutamate 5-kinase [Acinetobacter soli]MCE6007579.1 glutamate 5-kinase [Acinetobacter soli]
MGMREEIQQELAAAFDAEDELADAVNTFTCSRKVLISSNPATGEDVFQELAYSGRGVLFGSWEKDLVRPSDYLASDSKAVLLRNEVLSGGNEVEPQVNDEWLINSEYYRVVSYGSEPSKSVWTVQLRRV